MTHRYAIYEAEWMERIWDPASYRAELGKRKVEPGGVGSKELQVPEKSPTKQKKCPAKEWC